MPGYTKLFSSIIASTVWREDDKTRIVWITMLAMCDRRGVVEGSIPGLADFARVSIPDVEQALAKLSGPDRYSRSQVEDGRRIRVIDGGWALINFEAYRQKLSEEERREYNRVKKAEERAKLTVSNVSNVNDKSALSAHTEISTRQQHQTSDPSPTPDLGFEASDQPTTSGHIDSSATSLARVAKPILRFRTIGSGPKEWHLTQEQLDEWVGDYPGLDVLAECRKGGAWLKANGYKTAKGMPRFFVSWFNRAVSNGGARHARPYSPVSDVTQGNMEAAKRLIDRVKQQGGKLDGTK